MLHHDKLTNDKLFDIADSLFGCGVRRIDLANSDHIRVIEEKLPRLYAMAESTITDLKDNELKSRI